MSVLVADIGRTTCRLARYEHAERVATARGACGVSLSDVDGVEGIRRVVAATLGTMPPVPLRSAVLGVTGAATSSAAASALRAALESDLGVPATVTSDVAIAHAGGLGGEHGVLTIAGTGAIALAVSRRGVAALVDGWGPLLGDAGSAADVGRAGLAAAFRAHDGRSGGSPALATAAEERFGDLDGLPGRLHGDAHGVRSVAAFATDVAAAARAGDPVARGILAGAVRELTQTTLTACRHARHDDAEPVGAVLAGGLFDLDDLVAGPVRAALAVADPLVDVRPAAGDALDGAYALATGDAGLHHRLVWVRRAVTARGAGAVKA